MCISGDMSAKTSNDVLSSQKSMSISWQKYEREYASCSHFPSLLRRRDQTQQTGFNCSSAAIILSCWNDYRHGWEWQGCGRAKDTCADSRLIRHHQRLISKVLQRYKYQGFLYVPFKHPKSDWKQENTRILLHMYTWSHETTDYTYSDSPFNHWRHG